MSITVYAKPSYTQCNATKRALAKARPTCHEVDLAQNAGALEAVRAMGYQSAPVVFAKGNRWSDFRPGKIKVLTATAQESAATIA